MVKIPVVGADGITTIGKEFLTKYLMYNCIGEYHYHRKGILDEIPHVQLYWGVIIIKKSNYKKIEEIFSQYSTIIETRVVKCNKDDILRLTEHSP